MLDYRHTIDEISSQAKELLKESQVAVRVIDNKDVYDVQLMLKNQSHAYMPHRISFSHGKDTGYYMDIDDVTWEFEKDEDAFKTEAVKYLKAIQKGRVKMG